MSYPHFIDFAKKAELIQEYIKLRYEYGDQSAQELADSFGKVIDDFYRSISQIPDELKASSNEPDQLDEIRKLRPDGPRRMKISPDAYRDKLEGAFLARMAGCTLGAPFEFHEVDSMEKWAKYTGDSFPPTDYWSMVKSPDDYRYKVGNYLDYTRAGIKKVPVDDDITYTILGLLIAEDYGTSFTTENVGKAWLKYLPYACTAEEVALENLKKGIASELSAEQDNPYCQWIGADIRSDPFAYMAPGYPEKAAELAYYDAYISHRRNGIYGEMFFAAAQSAAFSVSTAKEALEIGLSEIPKDCALAKDIRWALDFAPNVKCYKDAREAVNKRFAGMPPVHTNNNACLTVFALSIGGNDMTKVISETVAMGLDNDCNAATAGSIVGALVGKKNIPDYWYKNFNNTVDTYLTGAETLKIDNVIDRFEALSKKILKQ